MSIGSTQPFRPAGTATLAASTTPASAALQGRGEAVLITNASTGTAFLRFGMDTTTVATLADTPVPAGGRVLLHIGVALYASAVLGSGTGPVYITRGDGTVY